ncbi:ATP-binding protein [Herbidospora sp. NBRC 101105]|uniref:sensor histidine kinase n=1 Tax=Herbidospora sp. NBRC 101105 TaxID=3032195 RepID=UPI0024A1447A|nr:ATP-binding protein [Herbidospora sp. NBRC 101105]GLX93186.1 two-component sensor histidine kinase [Herbidospora sp. NBRC 101105]
MRTIRTRLALTYTGLVLLTAVVLLASVNLSLHHRLSVGARPPAPDAPVPGRPPAGPPPPAPRLLEEVVTYQWEVTGVAIVAMTLVSLAVGWFFAGRMLRPVHRITATARRLSLSNLHERISLTGPRDELRELADTFDEMLARLERSVEGQRRFIATASHELRTPLAVQRAAIEIGLPDDVGPVKDKLLAANRRSERLIDALLTLAQAEHGIEAPEEVELSEVVRLAVAELDHGDVTVTVTAEPCAVLGDRTLLHRLVTNLAGNAVRHNVPGGTARVTLTGDGVLRVANTGPHVPPERFGDLFAPFRRIGTTRTQGAGLGLSIAAAIARAHGAPMEARPNPGGGLELLARFPAVS